MKENNSLRAGKSEYLDYNIYLYQVFPEINDPRKTAAFNEGQRRSSV